MNRMRFAVLVFVFVGLCGLPARGQLSSGQLPSEVEKSARTQVVMVSAAEGACAAGIVVGFDAQTVYIATAAHVMDDLSVSPLPPVRIRFDGLSGAPRLGAISHCDPPNKGDLAVVNVTRDPALNAFLEQIDFHILSPVPLPQSDSPVHSIGCSGLTWWKTGNNEKLLPSDLDYLRFRSDMEQGQSGGALYTEAWELVGMPLRQNGNILSARPIELIVHRLRDTDWNIPVKLSQRALADRVRGSDELARERAAIADSRRLAAEAIAKMGSRPDLARLLAVEAIGKSETFEALDALLAIVESSSCLDTILPEILMPEQLYFSPNGEILAIPYANGILLWNTKTRTKLPSPPAPNLQDVGGYQSYAVSFSPDGKWMAAAITFNSAPHAAVVIWPFMNGRFGYPKILAVDYGAFALSFSADSHFLASGGNSNIQIWKATSWSPWLDIRDTKKEIQQLRFASEGRILVAGYSETGTQLWRIRADSAEAIPGPLWSDRRLLAVTEKTIVAIDESDPTKVKFIDPDSYKPLGELGFVVAGETSAVISSDDRSIVFSDANHDLEAWKRQGDSYSSWTLQDVIHPLATKDTGRRRLAITPDGRWLALESGIWDLTRARLKLLSTSERSMKPSQIGRFSTDCDDMVRRCSNAKVHIIDGATNQPVGSDIQLGEDYHESLSVTSDGRFLMTTRGPIWEVETGKEVGMLILPNITSGSWVIWNPIQSSFPDEVVFQASYTDDRSETHFFLGIARPRSSSPPNMVKLEHGFEELQVVGAHVFGAHLNQIEIRSLSDLSVDGSPLQADSPSDSEPHQVSLGAFTVSSDGKTLAASNRADFHSNEVYVFDLNSRQQFRSVLHTGFDHPSALEFSLAGDELFILDGKESGWSHWTIGKGPLSDLALRQANRTLDANERHHYLND